MVSPVITVLLADDENHARARLRTLLQDYPELEVVAEAKDGNEALSLMVSKKPDLAFLDINMPGVSVFSSIPALQEPPLIVFQTAYSEHAAQAFDIDAIDYLLKPIRKERFKKAMEKLKTALKIKHTQHTSHAPNKTKQNQHVHIKSGDKTKFVDIADIVRIAFEDGFAQVYTRNESHLSDNYLSYFEQKLQDHGFFRCSRSDIVNINCIAALHRQARSSYIIELTNSVRIPLSRRRAQQLKKLLDL